jgi:hypothetical protein
MDGHQLVRRATVVGEDGANPAFVSLPYGLDGTPMAAPSDRTPGVAHTAAVVGTCADGAAPGGVENWRSRTGGG